MKFKIALLMLLAFTAGQSQTKTAAKASGDGIFAELQTNKGKIVVELEYQKTPVTVANFISLAEGTNTIVDQKYKGKPFFDGLKFHRVIANFMIQGGDPLGTGAGDPGYKFKDEITDLKHDRGGILSMANSGPATNGSQFFITHKETNWLDGKHTVFGHVTSGMDIVNSIAQNDVIEKVTIIRKGADAKKFDASKVFATYYATKSDEQKREAAREAEEKRINEEKMAVAKKNNVAYMAKVKDGAVKTESGLEYKIVSKGKGVKPAEGAKIFVHYAGYLEDGTLFDSSYEEVNIAYGTYDKSRAAQNGYMPFPFTAGSKSGLIAGFLETLNQMSIGDKAVAFIPASLGYGERGAGDVIPPNTNLIFEIELLDAMPKATPQK